MRSLFIIFFLVFGCSTSEEITRTKPEVPASIVGESVSYFLPLMPKWRSFSSVAKCFQKSETQFLNHKAMSQGYSLPFEQSIEIQAFYNYSMFRKTINDENVLRDPSEVLFESIEKIMGKVRFFDFPKFDSYNLIFVDGLEGPELKNRLTKFLDSRFMNEGVPILMSFCLKSYEVEALLTPLGLENDFPYAIGGESLSVYNNEFEPVAYQYYYLKAFFKDTEKLKVFTPENLGLSISPYLLGKEFQSLNY